jgi:DNA modification methylase
MKIRLRQEEIPPHLKRFFKPTGGLKQKSLMLIPERFAISMQDAGWWVRSRIAWCKTSAMPESVKDRPSSAWEHIWMFTKSARYYWDAEAVRQSDTPGTHGGGYLGPRDHLTGLNRNGTSQDGLGRMVRGQTGANLRNYWLIGPEPLRDEHYAAYPSEIPRRCILAASRPGDAILDPFLGSGTTLVAARCLGRRGVGVELNPEYAEMARRRIERDIPTWALTNGKRPKPVTDDQLGLFSEAAS